MIKGLIQLGKFRKACIAKHPSLKKFHQYKSFEAVLITIEPLYLINSELFKDMINEELSKEGLSKFDWMILSINELEVLQAHIEANYSLNRILNRLKTKHFNEVLDELNLDSKRTFKHCCLYKIENEIYRRIGI